MSFSIDLLLHRVKVAQNCFLLTILTWYLNSSYITLPERKITINFVVVWLIKGTVATDRRADDTYQLFPCKQTNT